MYLVYVIVSCFSVSGIDYMNTTQISEPSASASKVSAQPVVDFTTSDTHLNLSFSSHVCPSVESTQSTLEKNTRFTENGYMYSTTTEETSYYDDQYYDSERNYVIPRPPFASLQEIKEYISGDNKTLQYLSSLDNSFWQNLLTAQLEQCPFVSLCNHQLGIENPAYNAAINFQFWDFFLSFTECCSPCQCNVSTCLNTGDCCPDVLHDLAIDLEQYHPAQQRVCTELSARDVFQVSYNSSTGILAIGNCPDSTSSSLHLNCTREYKFSITSLYDMVPCSSAATNYIYRNKYCAACNGITACEYFNVAIADDTQEHLQNYGMEDIFQRVKMGEKNIDIKFLSKDQSNYEPCDTYIDTCNITGLWENYDPIIEKACRIYSSVTWKDEMRFRNIFCLQCNGLDQNNLTFCEFISRGVPWFIPFSGLLKSSRSTANNIMTNDGRCGVEQHYDILKVRFGYLLSFFYVPN